MACIGTLNCGCFDRYYVAYKPITLSSFVYIHCHSCMMFVIKSMSIYNDQVNYDDIII